ncbi:MAG: hypothetical protein NUV52_01505 [Candidatus Roizmanbacteria bacterium]|nr:hypothetical protein [Candidatus Roizmanbacteria bacterium]
MNVITTEVAPSHLTTTFQENLPVHTDPLMGEINVARTALEQNRVESIVPYMRTQEFTALMEAVNPESKSIYTLPYDREQGKFMVSGLGFVSDTMKRGIASMRERIRHEHDASRRTVLEIEYRRRLAELAEQESLDMLATNHGFHEQSFITISPFPEEAYAIDPQAVKELGYFDKKRIFKVRIPSFDEQADKVTITEYLAEGSNLPRIQQLVQRLFHQDISGLSTTEILNTPFTVKPSDIPAITEGIKHELYGSGVGEVGRRCQLVSEHSPDVIDALVELDLRLGEALKHGTMSEDEAIAEKKRALVAHYTLVAMRTGLGAVAQKTDTKVRAQLAAGSTEDIEAWLSNQEVSFYLCGMELQNKTRMGSPLESPDVWLLTLFGQDKERRVVTCPGCKEQVVVDGLQMKNKGEHIRCPCGSDTACGWAVYGGATKMNSVHEKADPALKEVAYGV